MTPTRRPRTRTWTSIARSVGTGVVCAAALTSCVQNLAAPARTEDGYQAAVGKTAGAAGSAVATTKLQADAALADRAFFPYLTVAVSDSEDELGSVVTTFSSIQPPPGPSVELRSQVMDLLDRSEADVSAVRISLRNGSTDGLEQLSEALGRDADELARLAEG